MCKVRRGMHAFGTILLYVLESPSNIISQGTYDLAYQLSGRCNGSWHKIVRGHFEWIGVSTAHWKRDEFCLRP